MQSSESACLSECELAEICLWSYLACSYLGKDSLKQGYNTRAYTLTPDLSTDTTIQNCIQNSYEEL